MKVSDRITCEFTKVELGYLITIEQSDKKSITVNDDELETIHRALVNKRWRHEK